MEVKVLAKDRFDLFLKVIDNLETKPDSNISKDVAKVEDPSNYFRPEDFVIGETMAIAGRDVLIHDCDDATKKFYKKHFDRGQYKNNNFRRFKIKPSFSHISLYVVE